MFSRTAYVLSSQERHAMRQLDDAYRRQHRQLTTAQLSTLRIPHALHQQLPHTHKYALEALRNLAKKSEPLVRYQRSIARMQTLLTQTLAGVDDNPLVTTRELLTKITREAARLQLDGLWRAANSGAVPTEIRDLFPLLVAPRAFEDSDDEAEDAVPAAEPAAAAAPDDPRAAPALAAAHPAAPLAAPPAAGAELEEWEQEIMED